MEGQTMSTPPTSNAVAAEIKKLDWDEPEKYKVEWKSADRWDPDATYTVKEIRFGEGGRPMVKIEGPGGGEFLIDSNPSAKPKVKYHRTDGYTSADRLQEVHIYEEKVSWRNQLLRYVPGVGQGETTGAN
jgi:hypothetical protein